ncbi:MAG TPA: hypothetical protein DCL63_13060 [Firmicutes bacterium]|jgi:hypothetical protein|nr:hypothetical protein [Bacillota bacterium]HBK60170.1 hypothetical protein [Bacillota bacterium]
MSLGLLYALIKYGAPVFLTGIAVVLSIIFDWAEAFARGFTGSGEQASSLMSSLQLKRFTPQS